MTEEDAMRILGESVHADNSLYSLGWYLCWIPKEASATLDGEFSADELEAIAWWMRNKQETRG